MMKTPVQGTKVKEFYISSKKNTPVMGDGWVEIGRDTSSSKLKSCNFLFASGDMTPEIKQYYEKGIKESGCMGEENAMHNAARVMSLKKNNSGNMLSRNNSGSNISIYAMNKQKSLLSQSTASIRHHAARSFALHL